MINYFLRNIDVLYVFFILLCGVILSAILVYRQLLTRVFKNTRLVKYRIRIKRVDKIVNILSIVTVILSSVYILFWLIIFINSSLWLFY